MMLTFWVHLAPFSLSFYSSILTLISYHHHQIMYQMKPSSYVYQRKAL